MPIEKLMTSGREIWSLKCGRDRQFTYSFFGTLKLYCASFGDDHENHLICLN